MAKNQSAKGLPKRTGKRSTKYPVFFARTQERKLRHALKRNGRQSATALKDLYFNKIKRSEDPLKKK